MLHPRKKQVVSPVQRDSSEESERGNVLVEQPRCVQEKSES